MPIPIELHSVRQWTHSYSVEEPKRPAHFHYEPEGALTLDEAKKKTPKYVGFYVTHMDRLLLVDFDHIDTEDPFNHLPLELAALVQMHPTYIEASPSGKGLRLIYRLPTDEDKSQVQGKVFYLHDRIGLDEKKDVQINFGPPWMTVTGKEVHYSSGAVGTIPMRELDDVFHIPRKGVEQTTPSATNQRLPSVTEIASALYSIKLDQNPRVVRAAQKVYNSTYQHYEFWVKILMALHDYATRAVKQVECLEMAINWSSKDMVAFSSDEDVMKHWRSFSSEENQISYRTLFGIANACVLKWPVPRKQTKDEIEHNRPKVPLRTEYANFKALIDYYDIKLYRDSGNPSLLYVSGDRDVVDKYFLPVYQVETYYDKYHGPFNSQTLTPAFHILCQDHGFIGIGHGGIDNFIINLLSRTERTLDLIKMYFELPFEMLPASDKVATNREDEFEYLFSCLDIDYMTDDEEKEGELYKAYYKKWFMGLIRNIWHANMRQSNNALLLLTGREQIRKTSHFKFLLPQSMRGLVAFTTHGFANETSMRDVSKLSACNIMLIWDEIEQYLTNQTESNFKKIIDGNPQQIIDKYEISPKTIVPKAIYGATSNMREFHLGDEGSRRIFHIPVKWVDTDKMDSVNWYKLINDLRQEVRWILRTGVAPWLLTEDQLTYQRSLHDRIRSKNSIDWLLGEIFDFETPLKIYNGSSLPGVSSIQSDVSGTLMSAMQVTDVMTKYGVNVMGIKRLALIKSLERLCGAYTNSSVRTIQLHRPKATIYKGLASQGTHKKWVMPPIKDSVKSRTFTKLFLTEDEGV